MEKAAWEIVVDDRNESVRRLPVVNGWIYQTQVDRAYDSVYGTIGRERDPGRPTWGPLVFVPAPIEVAGEYQLTSAHKND